MKTLALLLILALFTACAPRTPSPIASMDSRALAARHWRVAVLDLNYGYEAAGTFGSTTYVSAGKNGGKVVAGVLAADLAKLPNFTVIDRGEMAKVLAAASLPQSGVVDPASASRIGELLGADAVITGELTDYVVWNKMGNGGSTISFSIRMVDTNSGQVLLDASISRPRLKVDSYANVQMTCKELVDDIRNR